MKIRLLLFSVLISMASTAREGMWLPYLLESLNAAEMQAMGLEIPVSEIYAVNQSSLKDAVVSFGGFCTGEVISGQGLVLTNHHCGYGAIQSHSSLENDLLKNGYWSEAVGKELHNKGLFVTFIRSMEDVTNLVLAGTDVLEGAKRDSAIVHHVKVLVDTRKAGNGKDYLVRSFFYGNQYILFETETFRDVRLVGAPPSFIGKYGADTDNWVWPRHTGDFSIFRIYADANNKPAEYSPNNVPYKAPRHLEIELGGTEPGAFTMVYGFPGRTQEYLPAVALEQTLNNINPGRIGIRDINLDILDQKMRTSDEVRIKYAAKYASTANAWKKWQGESLGLRFTKAVDKRRQQDEAMVTALKDNPKGDAYTAVYDDLNKVYADILPLEVARNRFVETFFRGTEDLAFIYRLGSLNKALEGNNNTERDIQVGKARASAEGFFKDYDKALAQEVFVALANHYTREAAGTGLAELPMPKGGWEGWADKAYAASTLLDASGFDAFLNLCQNKPSKALKLLAKDPFFVLSEQAFPAFFDQINTPFGALDAKREALLARWMTAQMVAREGERFYPDANSTLRLAYGKLEGFSPRDGVTYAPYTTIDGALAKYVPGDYEFDLDERYRNLVEQRNFGKYADGESLPVCFLASNHTTGGNSGSPVLNGKGRLIGLNFDRCWESTMSDLNYDVTLCRNIAVDIRYVLWVVDVYAGASYLLDELTLVNASQ